MSDLPSDSILEKARALLRLASNEAATEHEASLAMERLQALLLKHNLDMADAERMEGEEPCQVFDEEFSIGGRGDWKVSLLNMVARQNFCRVMTSNGIPHVIGRKYNIEVVKEMSSWLISQLDVLATTQAGVQAFLGEPVNGLWRRSFLLGAINRLKERLKELSEGQDAATKALVLDLATESANFMHQAYPFLRRGVRIEVDPNAYRAGVGAGSIVSVMPSSRQVEG